MMRKIRFIINPKSGLGHKDKLPRVIKKYLDPEKFTYDIAFTQYRGHAEELSRSAAAGGYDLVCISGGDGSVNEAARALIHTPTALAILPTGSGNGIALHLGIPTKWRKAIELINTGRTETIDTFTINGIPVIGFAGFGFDALIARKFDQVPMRGLWGYIREIIREIGGFHGKTISINGQEYSHLFLCSIANTSQFGNNFRISPESRAEDGILEIAAVGIPLFFDWVGLGLASRRGTIHKSPYTTILRVREARIRLEDPNGHIDGEPVEFNELDLEVRCLPKSLKVIQPHGSV